ncbi:XapX domain-containing protein [Pandoraea sp. NPDC090278]|uniref:XapX domain-containing protein n=1 Tax=Pandoraea sp. NPDC090278 TaxID=3364391 RepID=UPI00383A49D1
MQYVYVGRNELVALIVGLVTGTLYSWLNLPIPAPNVLGGIFAIIFTYLGYLIVNVWRRSVTFGRPPAEGLDASPNARPVHSSSRS